MSRNELQILVRRNVRLYNVKQTEIGKKLVICVSSILVGRAEGNY